MSLAERRWLRLFTLTLLFFAQGIPWGFLAIALPSYLTSRGLDSADRATLYAMSYWPYVFKWVWGPAMDAFTIERFGRRRPWILFAQTMMAVTIAGMLVIGDPLASFGLLVPLVLVHTVFNAMQNVAVDGLAIDLLSEQERGKANGLMYGAKYAGGAFAAVGLSRAITWWGFHAAIAIQAVILFAIALVPLLVRERSGPPAKHHAPREVATTLLRVFRLRSPLLCALLMLLANIAIGMISVIEFGLFTQHLAWKQEQYSWIAGGPGLMIGATGSVVAGFLADKLGHRRIVGIACVTMSACWLVFALGEPLWTEHWFAYTLVVIEPFTQAVLIVSLWTLCMDNSVPRTAATQFAAYTSLTSLSTIIGVQLLGAHVEAFLDYRGIFVFGAALQLVLIPILPFIDLHQARRALVDGAEPER